MTYMTQEKPFQQSHTLQEVADWILIQAQSQRVTATVHTHLIREEADWLYIPVHLAGVGTSQKAILLRKMENLWENQVPKPHQHLLLLPSAA